MIILKRTFFLLISLFGIIAINGISIYAQERPNIVLVITDDQGYGDLGCTGNPYIKTPSLDQFSNESVFFTNFHVSTTCAPTRGALMTGRHTNRVNVFHTISGRSMLFEDETLIPQILGQNGYTNGMFGKWHLGDNYPYRPEDRGFHEVVRHGGGGICQMPDYWGNDYFDDHYWHNGVPEKYDGYCTDVFFNEALEFIEDNKDHPFFCYISTNAPHGPLNVPEDYIDMYAEEDAVPDRVKRFYGMISNIDDNFSLLQNKLEKLGLTDNTILIFMTDNGTASGAQVYNAEMRGQKGSEYEGGHRVPLMISWPDGDIGKAGGKKVDNLVAHYDLLPTLVDLLGLKYNPQKQLDGMSLMPLIKGEGNDFPDRILYMDTQRLQNLVKYKNYTVMNNDWRLVNGKELYLINEDKRQKNNVIEDYPDVAATLREGYERWWSSIQSEGPNERYAYIKAGTVNENPVRICSHDMLTGKIGHSWHQYGAARAVQATGCYKVEIAESGKYSVSFRRFPRESGLAINEEFEALEKTIEFESVMPASRNVDFTKAYINLADFNKTAELESGAEEHVFTMNLSEGKYDMEANLIDKDGRVYPSYFIYIEKL
jgi:arylsulfatase A-like enzyme